ncbi:hypothetical protein J5N97_012066 [Dioscorea zingiberensis]|uniref:Apple domain-containing protein n=1 Tax=Dioscorea zingiberensis TaxID=325984 RepID=A0A9D5HHR1_9LILI|nr:hypothetical protein J5N97_012066 [Dioscorea zingiberensis]
MKHVKFKDDPIAPLKTFNSKEGCFNSCLEDCDCEAAQYYSSDNTCWKQSLPLRFGRQDSNDTTLVFIKVGRVMNTTIVEKKLYVGVFVPVVSVLTSIILVLIFIIFNYRVLRKNMELEVDADEIILSEWVYSCYLAGELEKLTLDEDVDMVEFERAVKVGLWCIQTDPTLRPSMKNVIIMLEGCAEISSPPSTHLLF